MHDEGPRSGRPCRYFNEIAQYVLDCLHVATLQPRARSAVIATRVGGRSGMAIILTAAGGHPFLMDAEVSHHSPVQLAALLRHLTVTRGGEPGDMPNLANEADADTALFHRLRLWTPR